MQKFINVVMNRKTMGNYFDTPLMEITLRRYETPHSLNIRDSLKKICLALGLLQPGDTRDVIVDILMVLEQGKLNRELLSSEEVKNRVTELRKNRELSLSGTADSNIRRQLKRLRDMFLVEKIKNKYRILENQSLKELFEERIKKIILEATVTRVEDYLNYYENKKEELQK